jgi:hypothetical protein
MHQVARAMLGIAGIVTLVACQQSTSAPPPAASPEPVKQSPVERGKYLVEAIAGCDDCHTPKKIRPDGPEPDMTRRMSGHPETAKLSAPPKPTGGWIALGNDQFTAWAGPWGISYTANLTPDQNTGLGIWTEDMFIRAIRERKHMGQSRKILPPMPVHVFGNMTDDDLKAIWAFLRTLPPITNHVPDPVINDAPAPWTRAQKEPGN